MENGNNPCLLYETWENYMEVSYIKNYFSKHSATQKKILSNIINIAFLNKDLFDRAGGRRDQGRKRESQAYSPKHRVC